MTVAGQTLSATVSGSSYTFPDFTLTQTCLADLVTCATQATMNISVVLFCGGPQYAWSASSACGAIRYYFNPHTGLASTTGGPTVTSYSLSPFSMTGTFGHLTIGGLPGPVDGQSFAVTP